MVHGKAVQDAPPSVVVSAVRTQLSVAGLLVLLATIGFLASRFPPFDTIRGAEFVTVLLLACAAWLAVAAFGLRRGSRVAYRRSLGGLAFLVLVMVAASLPGSWTGSATSVSLAGDAGSMVPLLGLLVLIVLVAPAAAVVVLGLAVTTGVLLRTGTARRFFAGTAQPEEAGRG